jgi:hypothetical protein
MVRLMRGVGSFSGLVREISMRSKPLFNTSSLVEAGVILRGVGVDVLCGLLEVPATPEGSPEGVGNW